MNLDPSSSACTPNAYDEQLVQWRATEARYYSDLGMGFKDMTSHLIGEGAQCFVFGTPEDDDVIKVPKRIPEITDTVRSWDLGPDVDEDEIVRNLIKGRSWLIDNIWHDTYPADILGHASLVPLVDPETYNMMWTYTKVFGKGTIDENFPMSPITALRQPRAQMTVNEYLQQADTEHAKALFTDYTNFIFRQWYYGSHENTFKLGTNYLRMAEGREIWGNPLLLGDAGESTGNVYAPILAVLEKRWRQVFGGKDAPPLPEQHLEQYYAHMDATLTEDALYAVYNQGAHDQSSTPGPRSASMLMGAFEEPQWRNFCLDALDDIDHPKAFVAELDTPVRPFEMACGNVYNGNPQYKSVIVSYRQLPPNPLLIHPDKPMWYWELNFVEDTVSDALLNGREMSAASSGVSISIRANDRSIGDTRITGVGKDILARSMDVNDKWPLTSRGYSAEDEQMIAAFRKVSIARHRIIDGYPYTTELTARKGWENAGLLIVSTEEDITALLQSGFL